MAADLDGPLLFFAAGSMKPKQSKRSPGTSAAKSQREKSGGVLATARSMVDASSTMNVIRNHVNMVFSHESPDLVHQVQGDVQHLSALVDVDASDAEARSHHVRRSCLHVPSDCSELELENGRRWLCCHERSHLRSPLVWRTMSLVPSQCLLLEELG